MSSLAQFHKDLIHRPDWYFWDFHKNEAIFVQMDAQSYRESIFTDSRIVPSSSQKIILSESPLYQNILVDKQHPRKVNYIFHMAHCGSTLLARSFDFLGTTLVYREPRVLRKLGCSKHTDTESSLFQSRLDCACSLLTRTFNPKDTSIVKANVPVNFILPELIRTPVHDLSGVLLYQDLDIYLLNLYKNVQQRHRWIENVVAELALPISQQVGLPTSEVLKSPVAQKLVLLWIAQMKCFENALSTSSQMLPLNAEDYFAAPKSAVSNVAAHFGIDFNREQISELVDSKLYKSHSKSRERLPYNNELRVLQQRKQQEKYCKEIGSILDWTHSTFGSLPTLT